MTPDELDAYRDVRPFAPFHVHLADDQGFYVPTSGFVAHKPGLWSFIVYNLEDAGFRVVNLRRVTTVTFEELAADRLFDNLE